MVSAIASTIPAGFFGALAPKNTTLTTMRRATLIAIRHAWTTICAASTQDGGTGVVDRRRRIPCSRYETSGPGR